MKTKKIIFVILGAIAIGYGAFIFKKAVLDKGYPSQEVEKEVLLGNYVLLQGLPNTKRNRDKYRSVPLEEIKRVLKVDNVVY